jgi:ATP-dependent DNA helicase RecG
LVLNALIHRDYLSPIDVQIKIFDNRITFFNPGKLYGNLTVEDLKTNSYQAYTRNKLIAEAFYLTGDIEKYGSGFMRIREELKHYPTMQLICEEIPNGFLATLKYTKQKVNTQNTDIVKGVKNVVDSVVDNVVDSENMLIMFIREDPFMTAKQLASKMKTTERTAQRYIQKAQQKGLLTRIGSDRGGYWKISSSIKRKY